MDEFLKPLVAPGAVSLLDENPGYEGDLMARAGAEYAVGREAVAEFGEEAAGIHLEKSPVNARSARRGAEAKRSGPTLAETHREGILVTRWAHHRR